ncbi:hypothetical protein HZA33_04765, partial [Candidatus Pacearchaeota archaeon]|nr:hypothetical protein [Candidatus Pacearchaeota archaeon]
IGSNYLGKVLQSHNIDYHFCGHTHRYSQGMLGKCLIINIGSDYDMLKYALLDTEKKKIKIF